MTASQYGAGALQLRIAARDLVVDDVARLRAGLDVPARDLVLAAGGRCAA